MRLSLATRIFLAFAVVLVTFGAVSLFSIRELHRNQLDIRLLSEGYLLLSQEAAAIETFHKNHENDTRRLRQEQSVETRRMIVGLARLYFPGLMAEKLSASKALAERVLTFTPESDAPFVQEVAGKLAELQRRYGEYPAEAEAVFKLLEAGTASGDEIEARFDRLQQTQNALGVSIRLLHGALESRIVERAHATQERERRAGVAIIVLAVVAIGVGLLAIAFAARALRPVRTLTEGVSRIRQGDYSARLGLTGDDEIAVLAREFDALARSLKEREEQLQQKQQELVRAERLAAVGRVAAQIAHEVRNPLSSIGLNVEMLEEQLGQASFRDASASSETRALLRAITGEVDRLTEVTEEHLKLARQRPPSLAPEDVGAVLERVIAFSRGELERAGVAVAVERASGTLVAPVDEGQLRQVLLNLVRNAREAMPKGGTLTLAARVVDKEIVLEVRDTGSGVPAEAREKIFEPLFSTKQGGTGLGLSLSRQIIEAHHGSLTVADAAGGGSIFTIRLPSA